METTDNEGYPTEEFLTYIRDSEFKTTEDIMNLVEMIGDAWYFGDWGFKLHRKYKGKRKLELHTGGWNGNEDIIEAITSNIYLTHLRMSYARWEAGGHHYFEINY
ncbi:MAG TPA: hypothetical protein ENO18_06900 [Caldithrix sp.]|nr:hypothetical protein [Caldithrix sp.]